MAKRTLPIPDGSVEMVQTGVTAATHDHAELVARAPAKFFRGMTVTTGASSLTQDILPPCLSVLVSRRMTKGSHERSSLGEMQT